MGMIGRNLVKYLVDNNLASWIRVADRRVARFSDMSPDHLAAMDGSEAVPVETVQVDLTSEEGVDASFLTEDDTPMDIVFNCAAETASGRDDARYNQMVEVAKLTAAAAVSSGAKRYLFVSTASVYKGDKRDATESSPVAPWTKVATASAAAEEALRGVAGLPLVIARPSVVYGPGDERGLMPRCVCSLAYVGTTETMKFLWDSGLRLDTVHAFDVCRGLWHLAARATPAEGAGAPVYNLSSPEPTDQGRIGEVLAEVFGITTGFVGSALSSIARMRMDDAVADANDAHMGPWLRALKECGIKHSPISPFIHKELLYANHLAVDGTRITTELGFKYKVGGLSAPAVADMLKRAVAQGIFPAATNSKDLGLGANPKA
jgi:nucleoside-diphosphate-sugar epimerase